MGANASYMELASGHFAVWPRPLLLGALVGQGRCKEGNRVVQRRETRAWCGAWQPAPGERCTGTGAAVSTGTLSGPGCWVTFFVQYCSGVNSAWFGRAN